MNSIAFSGFSAARSSRYTVITIFRISDSFCAFHLLEPRLVIFVKFDDFGDDWFVVNSNDGFVQPAIASSSNRARPVRCATFRGRQFFVARDP